MTISMPPPLDRLPPVSPCDTDIGIWYWRYEADLTERRFRDGLALMNGDERERCRRFRLERDRRLYCATRFLIRHVLSRYHTVSPAQWQFAAIADGKPVVANPGRCGPYFNLSHTPGLVVAAVSTRYPHLGIDCETVDDAVTPEIAAPFLSDAEVRDLRELSIDRRPAHLIALWTLKESFAKALGRGLSGISPDRISLRIGGTRIEATFDAETSGGIEAWSLDLHALEPNYLIALCVGATASPVIGAADFACDFADT